MACGVGRLSQSVTFSSAQVLAQCFCHAQILRPASAAPLSSLTFPSSTTTRPTYPPTQPSRSSKTRFRFTALERFKMRNQFQMEPAPYAKPTSFPVCCTVYNEVDVPQLDLESKRALLDYRYPIYSVASSCTNNDLYLLMFAGSC